MGSPPALPRPWSEGNIRPLPVADGPGVDACRERLAQEERKQHGEQAKEILAFLNLKTGRNFEPVDETLGPMGPLDVPNPRGSSAKGLMLGRPWPILVPSRSMDSASARRITMTRTRTAWLATVLYAFLVVGVAQAQSLPTAGPSEWSSPRSASPGSPPFSGPTRRRA